MIYGGASAGGAPVASQALRRWLAAAAGLGIMVSAGHVLITATSMTGLPLAELDLASLWYVITGTAFGTAAIVRCVALLIALFAAMLALAATNRFGLTPALARSIGCGDYRPAISHLRRSISLEMGSAAAVLAIVAWLGTIEPPFPAG